MIRIVHIVEDMKIGGLERVIEDILMNLDKKIYEVKLLCLKNGGIIAERLKNNGYDVEILHIENFNSPFSVLKTCKYLRKYNFHIAHTHGTSAGVLGRFSAFLSGIPVRIAHVHSTTDHLLRKHHVKEKLLSYITHKIIGVSSASVDSILKNQKISKEKVQLIFNGINIPKKIELKTVSEIKKEFGIDKDHIICGTVAALQIHKGHCYLLKAVSEIKDITLLLLGDGPEKDNLMKLAIELKMEDRVIFAGNRTDVFHCINAFDMFILPSLREGHPISILEALAMEKCVLASEIGGIPEIIKHGKNGMLSPSKDCSVLKENIISVKNNPELRKKLAHNGWNTFVNRFTLKKMMTEITDLYTSLLIKTS